MRNNREDRPTPRSDQGKRQIDRDAEIEDGLALLAGAERPQPSREVRSRVLGYARSGGTRFDRSTERRRLERWALPIAAAAAVAGIIGLQAWSGDAPGGGIGGDPVQLPDEPDSPLSLTIGQSFPDFAAVDVATGEQISLSELRGDVILLNLWATWCGPCETEMPSMERLYRELADDGLRVVAISVDQESTSKVRRWVDDRDITFTVLHDRSGRFERWFQTFGVPESFVLDRAGKLIAREVGPRLWDSPRFGGIVRALLDLDREEGGR